MSISLSVSAALWLVCHCMNRTEGGWGSGLLSSQSEDGDCLSQSALFLMSEVGRER